MSYEVNTTEDKAILALSQHGEGLDNAAYGGTMRMVRGVLSHVNEDEAKIIDKYGKKGEELVVALADGGSINVIDGLPQYGLTGTFLDVIWDNLLGKEGLGGWLGDRLGLQKFADYYHQKDLKQEAHDIANESFQNTLRTAEKSLGPGGSIMQAKGHELGEVQLQSSIESEQAADQMRNLVANQGFEGGNAAQTLMNSTLGDISAQGDIKQKGIINTAVQKHDDVISSVNAAKNQALADYLATTEDPFTGSWQLDELNAYIDEMQT